MEIFVKLNKAWFQKHNSIGFMEETFIQMMDNAKSMFEYLEDVLHDKAGWREKVNEFYATDRKINKAEQDIREKIVNHFVLNPEPGISECLILMSVVKDAERLGDYCKNIFEMVRNPEFPSHIECHEDIVCGMDMVRDIISKMFDGSKEAFSTQSEEKAREVLKLHGQAKAQCDGIIEKTINGEKYGMTAGQAVVCALRARFLRRMASHLENINSSVLVPIHRLDFKPSDNNLNGILEDN